MPLNWIASKLDNFVYFDVGNMKLYPKNLRFILFIFLLVICLSDSKGQQILVDQSFNGFSGYGQHAFKIDSESELPDLIQKTLKVHLENMFGRNKNNLKYSHGQKVDLKSHFSETTNEVSSYDWLVPAYDLNYVFSDTTMGINSYYV